MNDDDEIRYEGYQTVAFHVSPEIRRSNPFIPVVTKMDRDFQELLESEPIYFIGDGAAYFPDHPYHRCWVTVMLEWDSGVEDDGTPWFEESLSLDCDGPHPNHWLAWEIEGIGLDEVVCGWRHADPSPMEYLLVHGVAPTQPFMVELDYLVSQDYWTREVDAIIDVRFMRAKPWTEEQVVQAWIDYLGAAGYDIQEEQT